MRLLINRSQKEQTGFFGGHKGMTFILHCRVELTPQEQQLIAQYKAENEPLTYITVDGTKVPDLTISSLVRGVTQEITDVTLLMRNEETIKSACQSFKSLLAVMSTFGGWEVIEF